VEFFQESSACVCFDPALDEAHPFIEHHSASGRLAGLVRDFDTDETGEFSGPLICLLISKPKEVDSLDPVGTSRRGVASRLACSWLVSEESLVLPRRESRPAP